MGVRVTAVIPATNEPPTLARCVAALQAADATPDELVVVTAPPRTGPAQARNHGAALSGGDVLVFVDADVLVHRDAIARIRLRLERDPSLSGVFGSYDDAPQAPGLVSAFRNLLHHHVHQTSPADVSSFWAGLGAIRRDAFFSLGGFDAERYGAPSIEDIELGARAAAAELRIELDPTIQGTHLKQWTLLSMLRTDVFARGAPWVALSLRRHALPVSLNLAPRHRVSAAASIAVAVALGLRRRGAALLPMAVVLVVNRDFYRLVGRRRGPAAAVAAFGLHLVHHLASATAVPVGIWLHLREQRRLRRRRRDAR